MSETKERSGFFLIMLIAGGILAATALFMIALPLWDCPACMHQGKVVRESNVPRGVCGDTHKLTLVNKWRIENLMSGPSPLEEKVRQLDNSNPEE